MEKPLTPEEDFLESKGLPKDCIVESDIDQDDYFQYDVADMLKEYAQMKVEEKASSNKIYWFIMNKFGITEGSTYKTPSITIRQAVGFFTEYLKT